MWSGCCEPCVHRPSMTDTPHVARHAERLTNRPALRPAVLSTPTVRALLLTRRTKRPPARLMTRRVMVRTAAAVQPGLQSSSHRVATTRAVQAGLQSSSHRVATTRRRPLLVPGERSCLGLLQQLHRHSAEAVRVMWAPATTCSRSRSSSSHPTRRVAVAVNLVVAAQRPVVAGRNASRPPVVRAVQPT